MQRLVAVLSVPAVTRGALLTDGAPDLATGLPEADAAVLRAAGWTPQNGLRSLLNFSGDFRLPLGLFCPHAKTPAWMGFTWMQSVSCSNLA